MVFRVKNCLCLSCDSIFDIIAAITLLHKIRIPAYKIPSIKKHLNTLTKKPIELLTILMYSGLSPKSDKNSSMVYAPANNLDIQIIKKISLKVKTKFIPGINPNFSG